MIMYKHSISLLLFFVILSSIAAKLVEDGVINEILFGLKSLRQYAGNLEQEMQRLKDDSRKDRLRIDYLESQLKLQSRFQESRENLDNTVRENTSEQQIPLDNRTILQSLDPFETSSKKKLHVRSEPSGPSDNVNHVAFSVYLHDYTEGLGYNQIVPFQNIAYNEGNGFNAAHHIFYCPVSGVYVFMSSVTSGHYKYGQTELIKDGASLMNIYSAGATSGHGFDQGFNSVITRCNEGEAVWVRAFKDEASAILGVRYTTFSGFLLWS